MKKSFLNSGGIDFILTKYPTKQYKHFKQKNKKKKIFLNKKNKTKKLSNFDFNEFKKLDSYLLVKKYKMS